MEVFFSWFRHFQWSWGVGGGGAIVGLRVQFPLRPVCSPNSCTSLAAVATSRPRARREREQCESVPLLPLVNSSLPCQASLSRRGSPPPHNRGPLKVKLVIILFTSATAGCQMERVAVKGRGWWIRFLLASHLLFANFFYEICIFATPISRTSANGDIVKDLWLRKHMGRK